MIAEALREFVKKANLAELSKEKIEHPMYCDNFTSASINMTFDETEYGALINQAVALRFSGDESQAVPLWQEVLRLDEINELANTGIGKAYLSAEDNANAMTYLRRGMNREYYSVAFKRWRNERLRNNISFILSGVVAAAALAVLWVKAVRLAIRKKAKRRNLS